MMVSPNATASSSSIILNFVTAEVHVLSIFGCRSCVSPELSCNLIDYSDEISVTSVVDVKVSAVDCYGFCHGQMKKTEEAYNPTETFLWS